MSFLFMILLLSIFHLICKFYKSLKILIIIPFSWIFVYILPNLKICPFVTDYNIIKGYKQLYFYLYYIVGANCVRPFLICFEFAGDRRSPLRVDIEFNLTATVSRYISANSLGGSKPPPYTGKVNLMLTATTQYHTKSNIYF